MTYMGVSKFELLWIWLLAFEVVGTLFGYHKFKGGFSSDFMGFHLRYDRNEVNGWLLGSEPLRRRDMLLQLGSSVLDVWDLWLNC